MRHWIRYGHVLLRCNNLLHRCLYPHFVCNERENSTSVSDNITVWIHLHETSAGATMHRRETSMCCLSALVSGTQNRWVTELTGGSWAYLCKCHRPRYRLCVPELHSDDTQARNSLQVWTRPRQTVCTEYFCILVWTPPFYRAIFSHRSCTSL